MLFALLAGVLLINVTALVVAMGADRNYAQCQRFVFEEGNIPLASPGIYPVAQEIINISSSNFDDILVIAPMPDPLADCDVITFAPDGEVPALDCAFDVDKVYSNRARYSANTSNN